MLTIRVLETRLLELFAEGHISGTVHTSIGQEVCAVGVVGVLDPRRDVVWSNHRGHGHYLAFTGDTRGLLCEVLGRAPGVARSIGGSQHLRAPNFFSSGVLGGIAPVAVGSALAERERCRNGVVAVFLGDGAMGEGVVYESMNIAALWQLPVLFVIEHNGYAQSTPTALEHAGDLARRAAMFDIPTTVAHARDPLALQKTTGSVVDRMRADGGPQCLVVHTYRLAPHSKGDDHRDPGELEAAWANDPLRAWELGLDDCDARERALIDRRVRERVAADVEWALAQPVLSVDEYREMRERW